MQQERLESLIERHLDRMLSIEEKQELERALLASAAARETFWQRARWHAAVRQWGEEAGGRQDAIQTPPERRKFAPPRVLPSPARSLAPGRARPVRPPPARRYAWRPFAAAAAVVALGALGWMQWKPWDHAEPAYSGTVARITHAAGAVWADASGHEIGEALPVGTLRLAAGALQIDFLRGGRVVLEGPAEFEVLSANAGALRRGRLTAIVPASAHGFSVRTPSFLVIDHGTRFGCVVPSAAAPEVHVFEGEVGLEAAAHARLDLHQSEAVRLEDAHWQPIRFDPNPFLTEEKLSRLESAPAQLGRWRQAARALRQHAGLLLYYDFEPDRTGNGRTLSNRVPGAPPETNGAVEGCEWTEGRWPGKTALAFNGVSDRVRLALPGEYRALTFLASLHVNGTPNRENCLLQPAPSPELGEVRWHISGDGMLAWSVHVAPRGSANQWLHAFSEPVMRGEVLGSWHQVAAVFDGDTVRHYLDGKAVGSGPVRLPGPVRLGDLQIGTGIAALVPRVPSEAAANFFGGIDEFAILSVPLPPQEIRRLYEQGALDPDRAPGIR